jgi:hypothetical protein
VRAAYTEAKTRPLGYGVMRGSVTPYATRLKYFGS